AFLTTPFKSAGCLLQSSSQHVFRTWSLSLTIRGSEGGLAISKLLPSSLSLNSVFCSLRAIGLTAVSSGGLVGGTGGPTRVACTTTGDFPSESWITRE